MLFSKRIRPPYSIICLSGKDDIIVPDYDPDKPILRTDSCIIVQCACFADTTTHIIFGWKEEVDDGTPPTFSGYMSTELKIIELSTAEGKIIAKLKVPRTRMKIVIWTNAIVEPDEVRIGIVK